ncbi:hypothetical protein COCVIDRAFT_98507, partial [Bipolaris victoriae FI3]
KASIDHHLLRKMSSLLHRSGLFIACYRTLSPVVSFPRMIDTRIRTGWTGGINCPAH